MFKCCHRYLHRHGKMNVENIQLCFHQLEWRFPSVFLSVVTSHLRSLGHKPHQRWFIRLAPTFFHPFRSHFCGSSQHIYIILIWHSQPWTTLQPGFMNAKTLQSLSTERASHSLYWADKCQWFLILVTISALSFREDSPSLPNTTSASQKSTSLRWWILKRYYTI